MEWLGLGGGLAVAGAAVVAIIMLVRFARTRSERADTMTDKALAAAAELAPKERRIVELDRAVAIHKDNADKLTAALATQRGRIAALEAKVAAVNKELDDVITKLGVHAPPQAVLDSIRDAARELRRELGLLQEAAAPEAVPGAPAANGGGGGAAGVLPDPA